MTTKKVHIMDSVPILDRIEITVFQPFPGHFDVDFICKEQGKQLTFDTKAKETMIQKINELARGKAANDPTTKGFIQEYIGRLINEYHRHQLVVIEDVPAAIDDHYAKLRRSLN